jgi:hypothetical protein
MLTPVAPDYGSRVNADAPLRRPDASAVAARVLCLATVATLAELAIDLDQPDADLRAADASRAQLLAWAETEGLTDLYGAAERELVERHPSTWTPQEVVNATWLQEAVGALLWALWERDELPGFDCEFEDAAAGVPVLESTMQFVRRAVLRPADEIDRARDAAELWHWRARRTKRAHGAGELDDAVRDVAMHAYEQGHLEEPIDGDFPAFGKPFRELTEDEVARASSIALERHFALNWLCGYSDDWDGTPTDT